MAKANLAFTRIGNDGYKFARREDGVWFVKEGFYHSSFGWTTTKWQEVSPHCDSMAVIETCLKAHAQGETGCIVGFSSQIIITDGKGLRLP